MRLTSTVRAQPSSNWSAGWNAELAIATPALLIRMSIPPAHSTVAVDETRQLVGRRHVADHPERRLVAVNGADLVDHDGHGPVLEIGDDHPGTLVGEQVRRRPAHAARGAGDDRPLAGDRAGQRAQLGVGHGRIS